MLTSGKITCGGAIWSALLTNTSFKRTRWLISEAQDAVRTSFDRKIDNCDLLCLLSPKFGKSVIEKHLPKLMRSQQPKGGWKRKDTYRITLGYLNALSHAGILDDVLPQLKSDPFSLFEGEEDVFSLLAHAKYPSKLNGRDANRATELVCHDICSGQEKNGSWDNSVLSTSHHLLMLFHLGIERGDKTLDRGAEFIFSSTITDVVRQSNNHGGMVVAHNMFSNESRWLEFEAAKMRIPQWDPKQLCYNHLPNVQTAYAICCLNQLGYQDDSRVVRACQNFMDMHKTYGGFCDSNIRNTIIERKRIRLLKNPQSSPL